MQNRLEHAVANLGVYEENLSASESRIRDVDVASEMVNFTRLQILSQSGTAMLAQANQGAAGRAVAAPRLTVGALVAPGQGLFGRPWPSSFLPFSSFY